ncbi:MAG: relaxase/mobilization nuclease domain-containing protein [Clostridium sp.]|nr:relaxase/mobilization nuclease domain-containing protein [Clostridium sp.]
MATTSLWKVDKRLDHVINYTTNEEKTKNNYSEYGMDRFDSIIQVMTYATNPDKTEKQFYTTGINCEVKNSVKQMQLVKMIYGKENGILAFHAYQSFDEGEVTPEIAHEIGVKLANEMWGDRFQVVVSTHLNTEHLHNHFVINSVSFKDGKKYYSNFENTALLRKTSDDICDEYGLKVLDEKTCKSGINFENFYRKSLSNSDYYKFAKEDIDYAINHS